MESQEGFQTSYFTLSQPQLDSIRQKMLSDDTVLNTLVQDFYRLRSDCDTKQRELMNYLFFKQSSFVNSLREMQSQIQMMQMLIPTEKRVNETEEKQDGELDDEIIQMQEQHKPEQQENDIFLSNLRVKQVLTFQYQLIKFKKIIEVDIQNKKALGRRFQKANLQNKQLKEEAIDQRNQSQIHQLSKNSPHTLNKEIKSILNQENTLTSIQSQRDEEKWFSPLHQKQGMTRNLDSQSILKLIPTDNSRNQQEEIKFQSSYHKTLQSIEPDNESFITPQLQEEELLLTEREQKDSIEDQPVTQRVSFNSSISDDDDGIGNESRDSIHQKDSLRSVANRYNMGTRGSIKISNLSSSDKNVTIRNLINAGIDPRKAQLRQTLYKDVMKDTQSSQRSRIEEQMAKIQQKNSIMLMNQFKTIEANKKKLRTQSHMKFNSSLRQLSNIHGGEQNEQKEQLRKRQSTEAKKKFQSTIHQKHSLVLNNQYWAQKVESLIEDKKNLMKENHHHERKISQAMEENKMLKRQLREFKQKVEEAEFKHQIREYLSSFQIENVQNVTLETDRAQNEGENPEYNCLMRNNSWNYLPRRSMMGDRSAFLGNISMMQGALGSQISDQLATTRKTRIILQQENTGQQPS